MPDGYHIPTYPKNEGEEQLITCFVSGEQFHESEMIYVPLSDNVWIHKSKVTDYVLSLGLPFVDGFKLHTELTILELNLTNKK